MRDLEWAANSFVWERRFAWRQSGLRIIQLQLIGLAGYAVLVLLGGQALTSLLPLSTTAWSLLHARLQTLDVRRVRNACDTHPALTGLHAIGGFGGLPATYARTLLDRPVPGASTTPAESALRRVGQQWVEEHLEDNDTRETFLLLAAEFAGTVDELLLVSAELTTH